MSTATTSGARRPSVNRQTSARKANGNPTKPLPALALPGRLRPGDDALEFGLDLRIPFGLVAMVAHQITFLVFAVGCA